MSVLINATPVDDGWFELRFAFDRRVIDLVKSIPGARWNPEAKCWRVHECHLAALEPALTQACLGRVLGATPRRDSAPPLYLRPEAGVLRPYQVTGYVRAMERPGYGLTFDPRVGKTPVAVAVIAGAIATNEAERAIVLYPNSVREEWERQLALWGGLSLTTMRGMEMPTEDEVLALASTPWLVLGVHYEILGAKGRTATEGEQPAGLLTLADQGPFVLIADEIQNLRSRKAPRTQVMLGLAAHRNCVRRVALTGTPMRNRPRDLWPFFEFIAPGGAGGYWAFCKRYAGAMEGEYGWTDLGSTNEDELAHRLSAVSYRVRRADVAAYLPRADRKVVLCSMSAEQMAAYKIIEREEGAAALGGLNESEPSGASIKALERISAATIESKLRTLIDRLHFHVVERGVKALVFANFHASLKAAWDALEPSGDDEAATGAKSPRAPLGAVPVFCAGGWVTSDKRHLLREQWKACPGPAVLLANTLSSGVGIDLSDADVAIYIELCWVPADFVQSESRIIDVHLGKRQTPPLFEYLLTRGTVDSDMGLALINKVQNIEAVVGSDEALKGIEQTLRHSGVVDRASISLNKADPDAVKDALTRLRDRLMGKGPAMSDVGGKQALAINMSDALADDEQNADEAIEDELNGGGTP